MNFPSQMFFNDVNHGYRAAILKKGSLCCFRFIWLWLLIPMIKRCVERCELKLYGTSLKNPSDGSFCINTCSVHFATTTNRLFKNDVAHIFRMSFFLA